MNSPPAAPNAAATFDEVVVPHLDAGYRLARWLVANDHDAEDVVQEAAMRALRYFRTYSGGDGRAWFLRIVRNTCYSWYGSRQHPTDVFDEEQHSADQSSASPEALLLHAADVTLIEDALRDLPDRHRELLVLRELEELSYQELASVLGIPIGTVMSGLSRARRAFRRAVDLRMQQVSSPLTARPSLPSRDESNSDRDPAPPVSSQR